MGLLYGKEEIRISIWQQNQLAANSVNPSANVAAKSSCRNSFSPSSNRGRNSNNRGSGNTQRTGQRSGSRSATGPCQLYGRKNHMAASCCYRFDRQYNVDSTSAYLAASSLAPDQNRYANSGVTHHVVTSDLGNLSIRFKYNGPNQLCIGNGAGLPTSHIGMSSLTTPTHRFLKDIFHIPQFSKKSFICVQIDT